MRLALREVGGREVGIDFVSQLGVALSERQVEGSVVVEDRFGIVFSFECLPVQ